MMEEEEEEEEEEAAAAANTVHPGFIWQRLGSKYRRGNGASAWPPLSREIYVIQLNRVA